MANRETEHGLAFLGRSSPTDIRRTYAIHQQRAIHHRVSRTRAGLDRGGDGRRPRLQAGRPRAQDEEAHQGGGIGTLGRKSNHGHFHSSAADLIPVRVWTHQREIIDFLGRVSPLMMVLIGKKIFSIKVGVIFALSDAISPVLVLTSWLKSCQLAFFENSALRLGKKSNW